MDSTSPVGSAQILRLVQEALDRFDRDSLDATVRRTVRVASLLGESKIAVKLGLDLKPTGGSPPVNAEMTRRLMANPEEWDDPNSVAKQAVDEWIEDRKMDDGRVAAHSIRTLMFWEQRELPGDDMPPDECSSNLSWALTRTEILERLRHDAFTFLCQWERRLSFGVTQQGALDAISKRVDSLLSERAPDVLEQFNLAFRRLREADDASGVSSTEALSQALTSCRRILKAVVDLIQPPDPAHKESEDGHSLTDDNYKNRLFEYLKNNVESSSYMKAAEHDVKALFDRFDAVDSLSSKGVHANVARSEAEFVALHTYLLAGQILMISEDANGRN